MKKLMTLVIMLLTLTLALPTTVEAAAKPKLTKTSVKTQKNKKVTVKIKNGKIKSVKSSNKKVASVSYKAYKKNKKNTGLSFTIKGGSKNGKATITVKTTKGKTLKCKVTNKVKSSKPKQPTPPEPTPVPPTPVPPTPTPEPPAPTPTPEEPEEPEEKEYYGSRLTVCSIEEIETVTLKYFNGDLREETLEAYYYCYFEGVWEGIYNEFFPTDDITEKQIVNAYLNRAPYECIITDEFGNPYVPVEFNTALSNAKGMKPVIQQILAMTEGKSDYEKCFAIGDWFGKNTSYDETLTHHSAAYLLMKGTGVCQSYKEANEILLSILGIKYDVYQVPGHCWIVAYPDGRAVTLDTETAVDGAKTSILSGGVYKPATKGNGNLGSWIERISEINH